MAKKTSLQPTAAELEILQILWKNGPSTVRFVNENLNSKKVVGYTTTLKMMQIMTEKKLLKRDSQSRSHIYRPAFAQQETQGQLLDSLLQNAFGGSASRLVMQALGKHKTSKEEIIQIRELLDKIERGVK